MDTETKEIVTEEGTIELSGDVTSPEAAAIAAAVGAHVTDQRIAAIRAEEDTDDEASWDGARFQFAGRIEGLTGCPRKVPREAPTDRWTAAGRLDRYDR